MVNEVRHRLYLLVPYVAVALFNNLVHEGVHYLAARLLGESVLEFRLLTNGWLTSQVVFSTPVAERVGYHWLVIAWAPAVVTTLIGYLVYLNRRRWLTRWPPANLALWYVGALFMCIDPLYFGVLSFFVGGDVHAAAAAGWSPLPAQVLALIVLVLSVWLVVRWQREARTQRHLYRVP
ncbi:MAG: hypothetical protein ACUVX1_09495 [Chloroflexota bacterium]